MAGWSPTLPAAVGDRLGLTGDVSGRRTTGAAVAGAVTFFLPCGVTQAVQLYAFSTGSARSAGAIMATFAIGTAPALLALAGAPTVVKRPRKMIMLRSLGVLVIGFAVINVSAALRLSGVQLSLQSKAPQAISGETVIYAGRPTSWAITSTAPFSCAASLVSQDLGVQQVLGEGRTVIELPALAEGTCRYSCSMGMYYGRIVAIAPPVAPTS